MILQGIRKKKTIEFLSLAQEARLPYCQAGIFICPGGRVEPALVSGMQQLHPKCKNVVNKIDKTIRSKGSVISCKVQGPCSSGAVFRINKSLDLERKTVGRRILELPYGDGSSRRIEGKRNNGR